MKTYQVRRDFLHNGLIHRKGDAVELSERQARYLLLNGSISEAETLGKGAASPKATSKPKRKRAAVKKSVKKRSATKNSE